MSRKKPLFTTTLPKDIIQKINHINQKHNIPITKIIERCLSTKQTLDDILEKNENINNITNKPNAYTTNKIKNENSINEINDKLNHSEILIHTLHNRAIRQLDLRLDKIEKDIENIRNSSFMFIPNRNTQNNEKDFIDNKKSNMLNDNK